MLPEKENSNSNIYLFESLGSTYFKAIAYHQSIVNNISHPYNKAQLLGTFFPEWFSLYLFMLKMDKSCRQYLNRPHYQLLKGVWMIKTVPNNPSVSARWSYAENCLENPEIQTDSPRSGFKYIFNENPKSYILFDGIDDWDETKALATKIFRPIIELRSPQPKVGMSR